MALNITPIVWRFRIATSQKKDIMVYYALQNVTITYDKIKYIFFKWYSKDFSYFYKFVGNMTKDGTFTYFVAKKIGIKLQPGLNISKSHKYTFILFRSTVPL